MAQSGDRGGRRPRSRPAALAAAAGLVLIGGCADGSRPAAAPASPLSPAPISSAAGTGPSPAASPAASTAAASSVPPGCAARIAAWSPARQAAQVLTVPADSGAVAELEPLVRSGIGGVLLFGRNGPVNLGARLRSLAAQAPDGVRPLVMSDEEGGGVQRLANLVGQLPWPRIQAATRSTGQVRDLAAATGRRLRAAGVDMDLAPVLDLDGGPGPDSRHPAGRRSFGTDPDRAGRYGVAFAQGLISGGVVPVVKHFPGLGRASANTDVARASVPPLSVLRRADLLPFRAAIAAGAPAVMVSHATVPGLSTEPVSLSRAAVTGLLRTELGFGGLVVTDSLSAESIRAAGWSVPAAGVRALQAGADLLLYGPAGSTASPTARATVAAVVEAVRAGRLPPDRLRDAVQHVLAAKGVPGC